MSKLQGSVAGATTIKSVTPDVRAPSRSWSLAFGGRVGIVICVAPATPLQLIPRNNSGRHFFAVLCL
jgi:hypothetical protein